MYFTQTQIANMHVKAHRTLSTGEIIENLIKGHLRSPERKEQIRARKYYVAQNEEILKRKKEYYVDGVLHSADGQEYSISGYQPDKTASNEKYIHAFYRNLVDQKVDYGYKNKVQISSENSEIDQILTDNKIKSDGYHLLVNELAVDVSNNGRNWIHPSPDRESGLLEWYLIDDVWSIPIYENHYQKKLDGFIRYYPIVIVNDQGDEKTVYKAEWWDEKQVTFYIETENEGYVKDATEKINPRPHFAWENTAVDGKNAGSWNRVPFVKIKNNLHELSDFRPVGSLIDGYDDSRSSLGETLKDVQDALLAFSGAEGESAAELRINIKTHKIALLGEGQKAEKLTVDVPKDAREYHDKQLKEDIYANGRGIDFNTEKNDSALSGISLKYQFAPLDMKVDAQYVQMKQGLKESYWFLSEFNALKNRTKPFDVEEITITFSKSVMVNDAEKIESLAKSNGLISQETILEQHPYVEDVEREKERLKAEKEERQKKQDEMFELTNEEQGE